jgi:hypothetical protein
MKNNLNSLFRSLNSTSYQFLKFKNILSIKSFQLLIPVVLPKQKPIAQLRRIIILFLFLFIGSYPNKSNAQFLKKLGNKVEKKVQQRVDRKVDNSIEKALDKTEEETEKSLKGSENKLSSDQAVSSTNSETSASASIPTTANLTDGLVMVSGDCTDFIWFKKGATMKFQAKDGSGKEMHVSQMTISNVYNESGATVADVAMKDDNKNEFDMKFKCAGDKLYMDFSAAIKQAMAKSNPETANQTAANVEMGFSDGFMSFPKNMYPGQMLDDAIFVMKTNSGGMNMDVTTSLSNRKVIGKEKINTPAGSFDCMKVSGLRKTTMNVLGKARNMGKPTHEHVWIAPGIGTIKQETYSEKGKLESMSHLIEFKI